MTTPEATVVISIVKLLVKRARRERRLNKPTVNSEKDDHEIARRIVEFENFSRWRKQFEFTGLWARVVQHEMDHLEGILICDHGKNVYAGKVMKNGT
jgi:hypothetical protein